MKILILSISAIFFVFVQQAAAVTLVVDNSTDNGSLSACTAAANDCSLRGAIAAAAVSGDRIQFDANVFDSHPVIGLSGSELIVNKNIQIGTGFESSQIDISANGLSRVFNVPAGFSVGLVNLAIRDGFHPQTAGGIYSEGNLTILSCIIRNNIGGLAGGVQSSVSGSLIVTASTVTENISTLPHSGAGIYKSNVFGRIEQSTISGNRALAGPNSAGGIFAVGVATFLIGDTITNNSAVGESSAGGVIANDFSVNLSNCIVAANVNNTTIPDVFPGFGTSGYNLIGNGGAALGLKYAGTSDRVGSPSTPIDPMLDDLAMHGGKTPTHAILLFGPEVDQGKNQNAFQDQRGLTQPVDILKISNAPDGDGCDIGAYELQWPLADTASLSGRIMDGGTRGVSGVVLTLSDDQGNSFYAISNPFGYYRFRSIPTSVRYQLHPASKRFLFPAKLVTVNEDLIDYDLLPIPN
jgi:hypothetical protein